MFLYEFPDPKLLELLQFFLHCFHPRVIFHGFFPSSWLFLCIQACIVVVPQHVSCLNATLHISDDVLLRMGIMNPCFRIISNRNICTQVVEIEINNQINARN
ncbi:hypothetical protein Hanom_Chr12g01096231 [Helianthus anomalus]